MDIEALKSYIAEVYHADAEFPWPKYPTDMIFRHSNNQKWFALVMTIPKARLGLSEDGTIDILNVKCEASMTGSFQTDPGIYPAYHMNKNHWISIALDGRVGEDKIKMLLDMSYELTARKVKRRSAANAE